MKKTRDPRKSLAKEIISELLGDVSDFLLSIPPLPRTAAGNAYYYHRLPEEQWQKIIANQERKRVIRDLERKKYLSTKKQGEHFLVAISTNAIVEALKTRIKEAKMLLSKGEICIVVFDFPNGATTARNHWRRLLLSCGFNMLQRSTYTTRKNVIVELVSLVDLLGGKKWIRIFRASPQY